MSQQERAKREAKRARRAEQHAERATSRVVNPEPHSAPSAVRQAADESSSILDRVQRKYGGKWVGVAQRPEAWAKQRFCYWNVAEKVARDGGNAVFGWYFNDRQSAHGRYIVLISHAVWAANRRLYDVTPFHDDPGHHPQVDGQGSVIFLVDDAATPMAIGDVAVPQPSRYFAVDDSEELSRYIAEQTARERAELEALVEEVRRASSSGGQLPDQAIELSKLRPNA